jgi:nitroreductase
MNIIDAIKQRRSIRKYKPDSVPEDVLNRLLNAMRLAPSGSNRQEWEFIVVRDAEMRRKIATACKAHPGKPNGQDFVAEAPVVIVACGLDKEARVRHYKDNKVFISDGVDVFEDMRANPGGYESCVDWDLAIALDHLSLAALEEGMGTCWIAGLDEREIKDLLRIPDDIRAPLVMTLGYPDEQPDARSRKPLDEIVRYETYL